LIHQAIFLEARVASPEKAAVRRQELEVRSQKLEVEA